ncbi:MAG: glycosyltransferase family 2 protein [Gemmatimonadales bacterium]
MIVVTLLIGAAALALLLPAFSDVISLGWIAWQGRGRSRPCLPLGEDPRFLFLVPAYNEELLIGECVRSLRAQRYPRNAFEVLVVADNCTDRTAALSREAGARCLERDQPALAGKPRAIAWALDQIELGQYDAVAVVDADTVVDRGFAAALADAAPLRNKAVQGYNGVCNPDESPITRMAAVFADAKCNFAYRLKARAGLNLPIRLGGCIGTDVLMRHRWTAFSIGEDWEVYAQLTERGVPIVGAPAARVYAQEARTLRQSAPQRRRWSGGKLTVLHLFWRPLLQSCHIGVRQKLDVIGEFLAPGPAVHLGVAGLLAVFVVALRVPGATVLETLLAIGVGRQAVYALAALVNRRDPFRAAAAFAFLPVYAIWRLGVELSALQMVGAAPWIRTERHRHRQRHQGG